MGEIDLQIFERLERLMAKKEEMAKPAPLPPAPPATLSPNASKDVLDLLEWQNGQIRDLQAKLGKLMAAGRRDPAPTEDVNLGCPHSQSAASLPQRPASPEGLQQLQPSARYTCQCNTI